jgi:hypothetical protein
VTYGNWEGAPDATEMFFLTLKQVNCWDIACSAAIWVLTSLHQFGKSFSMIDESGQFFLWCSNATKGSIVKLKRLFYDNLPKRSK